MSSVFPHKTSIVITTFPKLAPWLAKEVEALDYKIVNTSPTEVEINGYMDDCMRLNMYLRTAGRVLFQVQRFRANDPKELYKRIKAIPWEQYLHNDGYFSVTSYVRNEQIRDDRFANVRVKDAIADRMVEKTGKRPDSGSEKDQVVIHLYWKEDRVRVYFDTSGQSISKHGYRKQPFKAPMIEALAAGTIVAAGWDKQSPFVNPMCGSGTLAIEAAMMALNKAPGLLRHNFGFMHIKGYDREGWEGYQRLAALQTKEEPDFKIIASDLSKEALKAARANAREAGVAQYIEFYHCDFRETPIPKDNGVVIINPEYGERLGAEKDLESIYRAIGDFFKQQCKGYSGFVFTGNLDLAGKIGLRAKRRIEFLNARIDSRLLTYELYEGTRKKKGDLPNPTLSN